MSSKFRSNTIDMLCGSKYSRNSEKCDHIVGSSITGKDILIKYLIGVFATRAQQPSKTAMTPAAHNDVAMLGHRNSIFKKYSTFQTL